MNHINRLNNLQIALKKIGKFKASSLVHSFAKEIIKEAGEKEDLQNLFISMFPNENPGKLRGFAEQYFKKFRNSPDYKINLEGLSFDEVVNLIKGTEILKLTPKERVFHDLITSKNLNLNHQQEQDIDILKNSNLSAEDCAWVLKQYLSSHSHPMRDMISIVNHYYDKKQELNLHNLSKYKDVDELSNHIEEKQEEITKLNEEEERKRYEELKQKGLSEKYTDFIFQNDDFVVVLSGSVDSSRYWGYGTPWCTARKEENNLFFNYSTDIFLYYIITKETSDRYDPNNKFRKMSLGYVKDNNGNAKIVREGKSNETCVDFNNRGVTREMVKQYTAPYGAQIISAIENDVARRAKTKAMERIEEMTPDEFEKEMYTKGKDKIQFFQLEQIYKNTEKADIKDRVASVMAKVWPIEFLKSDYAKRYKHYVTDKAVARLAEEDPYRFLKSEVAKMPEYKSVTDKAVVRFAEKNPNRFLISDWAKMPEYQHLTNRARLNRTR